VVEVYVDHWAFRFGRFAQPKESNGLALDFKLWQHYGDNLEIERAHEVFGQPGRVRVLGIHNRARMGGFDDAVELAQRNGGTPALADVRRDWDKYAVGVALEQAISSEIGAFGRASWNDGRTETYAFTEIDRSISAGGAVRGRAWRRPDDTFGLAFAQNGISDGHRRYLASGGLGVFLGDGQLPNYAAEWILECYYSAAPTPGLWASVGYQLIAHPGYNADRGPVSIFSIRFHAEY
jgi:carbohydrate-selective porin OprB